MFSTLLKTCSIIWDAVQMSFSNALLFTKQQTFRLVEIQRTCRRKNKCDTKIENYFGKGRKHCGKRRKCCYKNVFKRLHNYIESLKVNPFSHSDTFRRPWETTLLKTLWEKETLLITSNFSFTHSVFYQFRELLAIFIEFKIIVFRLFQFGPV